MDWSNERYVRIYTRDTADDLVLSWQAMGMWPLLVRKADRAGVIATNHGARGVAALLRWPLDVVSAALAELLEDGRISECHEPAGYVIGNYVPAQEAPTSDAQRKREERERRSAVANNSVTKRDRKSRTVTPSHARSHGVTPSHSVPIRSDPDRSHPDRAVPREAPIGATPPLPGYEGTHDDMTGAEPAWWGTSGKRIKRNATVMPDGWAPAPFVAPDGVDCHRELEQFRDWALAKGSRFVDWQAAWRNWLRKAAEFGRGRNDPKSVTAALVAIANGERT